jgi:hypothetical protein
VKWLDTETRALLGGAPPEKNAPADTRAFALVLLAYRGRDRQGLVKAVQRAMDASEQEAERLLRSPLPLVLKKGLTYADAQMGQFELICCDAVSVFIVDQVVAEAPADYLADVYSKLLRSEEFQWVCVRIESIPTDAPGREFCDRFLAGRRTGWPADMPLMRKKARIMLHWAAKIGVQVVV